MSLWKNEKVFQTAKKINLKVKEKLRIKYRENYIISCGKKNLQNEKRIKLIRQTNEQVLKIVSIKMQWENNLETPHLEIMRSK